MRFYRDREPYVPVAARRANAAREAKKLAGKGKNLRPIHIKSKSIATTFWGMAWCKNLENYADWANRMPRGRTYARNGSIIDLQIEQGVINALVSGSSLYRIQVSIDKLDPTKWKAIRNDCSRQVSSLLDLMRGRLPDPVLKRLTDLKQGMFPSPKELKLRCSCPDYATMCKHVAATLYGVGYLLDTEPALFFKMRGVDQSELVYHAMASQSKNDDMGLGQQSDIANEDLSAIFGIDLASAEVAPLSNEAEGESKRIVKRAVKKPDDKKPDEKKAESQSESLSTSSDTSSLNVPKKKATRPRRSTQSKSTAQINPSDAIPSSASKSKPKKSPPPRTVAKAIGKSIVEATTQPTKKPQNTRRPKTDQNSSGKTIVPRKKATRK